MSLPLDRLIGEFEKKIPEEQRLPDFFVFKNEGDILIGQYIQSRMFHDYRNDKDREVLIIKSITDRNTYTVSRIANINLWWKRLDIKPGDYVMIRFEGTGETSTGRKFKKFTISKMTSAEFQKTLDRLKQVKTEEPEKPTTVEKPEIEKPKETETLTENDAVALNLLTKLLGFYGKISYDDIIKRLRFKGIDMPIDKLKELAGSSAVFDDDKQIIYSVEEK